MRTILQHTPGHRAAPRIHRRFLAAMLVAAVVASACGSEGPGIATELPTLEGTAVTADDGANTFSDDAGSDSSDGSDASDSSGASDDSVDGDADANGPESEVDPEVAILEFERCMSDFGIDVGSGSGGGAVQEIEIDASEGEDETLASIDSLFAEAAEACDPILDDAFGEFDPSPEQEAEMADQMLEMQRCMADNGVDIEMEGGGAFTVPTDMSSDELDELFATCSPEEMVLESGGE